MRILVTNDDGINADGLEALERIAKKLSKDVWVVAPEQEQSGAGHSLTLHVPVRVRKIAAKRFAVSGTPTDCVLLALKQIMGKAPDLVLSGINRGSNVGDDVTYSGTIAAAMEATLLGVPAIALSQLYEDREEVPYTTAEHFSPALIKQLVAANWAEQTLININFPKCPRTKVKGIRVCPQGKRLVNVALSERVDPKGRPYFWLGGARDDRSDRAGVDVELLGKGYVTVTPLRMDLTDYESMEVIRQAVTGRKTRAS
ncbi:MAG: 5'/3'-nucleotidase SurE [Rickettsiales bacterium]|nr:5'/3'-nucleotidase SurE [Rickettsiales bacterium]